MLQVVPVVELVRMGGGKVEGDGEKAGGHGGRAPERIMVEATGWQQPPEKASAGLQHKTPLGCSLAAPFLLAGRQSLLTPARRPKKPHEHF
jgi:hypothetical protein